MLFFKRILKEPEPVAKDVPRVERRSTRRFAVNPKFPLKAVLSFVGRDDTGAPMSNSRHGWHWKGRLIDCSEQGARIQMGPTLKVEARDLCDLMLTVDDFELTIPCHISNIREQAEGMVFGLKHDIESEETRQAYQQLLDVLALGSTLKLQTRSEKPDATGYLVERYASDRPSSLTVWRLPEDKSVAAFEFRLKDSLVRAAAGRGIKYLTGAADPRPAPAAKALEIQRLFNWVLPNLASTVPADVRAFLQQYAA
ncbi:MAG: PilZ domain-containing protein [Opitutae bacterium]|nr:PilZ domain-containing protein [Opitutae bacterium]